MPRRQRAGDRARRLRAAKGKKCPLPGGISERREHRRVQAAPELGYAPARSAPSQSAGPTQALTQPTGPPLHPTTRLPAPHPPPGAVPRLQSLPQLGSWALTEPERDGRRDPEGRTHRGTARERARAKAGPSARHRRPGLSRLGKPRPRPSAAPPKQT